MGLFDTFIKQLDNGLKAVESGALEDRLNSVADKLEGASRRTEATLDRLADKPAAALKTAEDEEEQLTTRFKQGSQRARKIVDIVQT